MHLALRIMTSIIAFGVFQALFGCSGDNVIAPAGATTSVLSGLSDATGAPGRFVSTSLPTGPNPAPTVTAPGAAAGVLPGSTIPITVVSPRREPIVRSLRPLPLHRKEDVQSRSEWQGFWRMVGLCCYHRRPATRITLPLAMILPHLAGDPPITATSVQPSHYLNTGEVAAAINLAP